MSFKSVSNTSVLLPVTLPSH